MCGIAGIVSTPGTTPDRGLLGRMRDRLVHRGPDGSGIHVHENVGLGHCRLAVIDTSPSALQPLFNEDGTVCTVLNGEIYNFRELRRSLQSQGHRFATASDTEVIVHAWEEHGPACLRLFRGMFSLAILDARKRTLFLARDRLGKKPLYFTRLPDRFLFASEIKGLLACDSVVREIDPAALADYWTFGYIGGPKTIYRDVRQLAPGHSLELDLTQASLQPTVAAYWQLEIRPDRAVREEEWLEEMDATLRDAVRLRLISDVPLGAFLSGGVDSSLVVAYMAELSDAPVRTFTIGFSSPRYDESAFARQVARRLGTDHHEEILQPDALAVLPELVAAYDEPYGTASAIPTYYLSEMTRREVTVALSGDGGDELFFGYDRTLYALRSDQISRLLGSPGRRLMAWLARALPHATQGRRGLEALARSGMPLFHYLRGFRPDRLSMLAEDLRRHISPPTDDPAGQLPPDPAIAERYQLCDLLHNLPDNVLVKIDRAAMRFALEVRCPLLDQHFVELTARIPYQLKVSGLKRKLLLKKLARRRLDAEVLDRSKQGFAVPLDAWFRAGLPDLVGQILGQEGHPMWRLLDRRSFADLVRHHVRRKIDASVMLWRLLFFHEWWNTHL